MEGGGGSGSSGTRRREVLGEGSPCERVTRSREGQQPLQAKIDNSVPRRRLGKKIGSLGDGGTRSLEEQAGVRCGEELWHRAVDGTNHNPKFQETLS